MATIAKADIRKRNLNVAVDPELREAITKVAQAHGMTQDYIVTKALALVLEELCEPVPVVTRRMLEKSAVKTRVSARKRARPTFGKE